MANQTEVRTDKITVPQRMNETQVKALAMQKAQYKVRGGKSISELHLGDSSPVTGDQGSEVEWSYSYHVVQTSEG